MWRASSRFLYRQSCRPGVSGHPCCRIPPWKAIPPCFPCGGSALWWNSIRLQSVYRCFLRHRSRSPGVQGEVHLWSRGINVSFHAKIPVYASGSAASPRAAHSWWGRLRFLYMPWWAHTRRSLYKFARLPVSAFLNCQKAWHQYPQEHSRLEASPGQYRLSWASLCSRKGSGGAGKHQCHPSAGVMSPRKGCSWWCQGHTYKTPGHHQTHGRTRKQVYP